MSQKSSSIFDFGHYRDYLKLRLATTGESRGLRTKLALKTGTQPAYISRVLSGELDFALEHAPVIHELLGHTDEEAHFFMLLLSHSRSGTVPLRAYYQKQIDATLEKRKQFLSRVKETDSIPISDQAQYYSRWYYLAIHVLVGIPQFQTRDAIAERLKLSVATVGRALEDLQKMGLVEMKGAKYLVGKKRIYLQKDSPWISNLHTHFRNRVIQKISEAEPDDLHFSAAISVSKKTFQEYRKRLLDLMSEMDEKIADSKDEEMYAISFDLFRY